ncbi:replication protein A 70 kDa DNA-binding subunit B-like [Solanum stenotomum]|uniref:replication protein A 70 kDa DNA-binding subunit B-like n=1 Tax=Solanum stenotomum TaxID=172797 RepID=UPI0020D1CF91|nr:replication protein A 70 kDa DNA-binding subunit B-like [Solanum stenotomum]
MTTELKLAKQTVPINKIPKNSVDSGTKIQATLFNKHIEKWKDFLKPNKSYYIAKGRYDRVNPNYSSVHKEVELAFTDNTVIKETDHEVSTHKISDGILSLDVADNLPNGSILDLICILVSVNPIIQNATSKRREIVVTNELMEPTTVTLWGDFAENNGAFLDKLTDDKPILGLCDFRVSIYKEADNKDIKVAPTKAMRRAIKVLLDHILDGLLAESQDSMYKFKATIVDILNKDEPWYLSCKTCRKKVKVIAEVEACTNCNIDNVEYAVRINLTDANPGRSLIAEEIHKLEDEAPIILEEEVRSMRKYIKRAKKTTNAAAQINQNKPKSAKD